MTFAAASDFCVRANQYVVTIINDAEIFKVEEPLPGENRVLYKIKEIAINIFAGFGTLLFFTGVITFAASLAISFMIAIPFIASGLFIFLVADQARDVSFYEIQGSQDETLDEKLKMLKESGKRFKTLRLLNCHVSEEDGNRLKQFPASRVEFKQCRLPTDLPVIAKRDLLIFN